MAGQKGTLKDLNLLLEEDFMVDVVLLPKDTDPGDFVKKGEELHELIAKRQDGIYYKSNLILKKEMSPSALTEAVNDIAQTIAKIKDPYTRKTYTRKVAQKHKLGIKDFREKVQATQTLQLKEQEYDPTEEYIRAGTEYFRIVKMKNAKYELEETTLVPWKKQTLTDDYGDKVIQRIPKYIGTTIKASHTHYQQVIDGFFNLYYPLPFQSKRFAYHPDKALDQYPEIERTIKFLKHIGGPHFDLLIDYITVLYLYPEQILPILILISEERNTGKSTFLFLMRLIFGKNATFCESADLTDKYNDDWIGKLVMCEELKLSDRAEVQDRIKTLSTGEFLKRHAKFAGKQEIFATMRFIFASNRWDAVKIDGLEVRYFALEIPTVKREDYNVDLKQHLREEIPYFLHLLRSRPIQRPNVNRAWFDPKLLQNETLKRMKVESRSWLENDCRQFIRRAFERSDLKEFRMHVEDVTTHLNDYALIFQGSRSSHNVNQIRKALKHRLQLKIKNSSQYIATEFTINHRTQWVIKRHDARGRHFHFKMEDFFTVQELKESFSYVELEARFKPEELQQLGITPYEPADKGYPDEWDDVDSWEDE